MSREIDGALQRAFRFGVEEVKFTQSGKGIVEDIVSRNGIMNEVSRAKGSMVYCCHSEDDLKKKCNGPRPFGALVTA
jgi:hypothetical protein